MIDAFEPDGSVVIWNRECERRLGWTSAEIEAMENPLEVFYPDPETRSRVAESIGRADGTFREYEVLAKDGSRRLQCWADFELPTGSRISVGYDVTEQREVEARLRQAQKLQALGTLTAGIAHDFNNLLTIIRCSAVLAQRDSASASELSAQLLTDIRAAADRGADLIRRLMSFGRRSPLRRKPLELDAVLEAFLPMLRRLVPESLTLDVSLDATGAVVSVDPVAVEQVIINLVTNARDATEGRGPIALSTSFDGDDTVLLRVCDRGTGVPDEIRERIFEPFFTTKEPGRGTGLGLPVVHELVVRHEGRIDIASEIGEGTSVSIRLPLVRRETQTPATSAPTVRPGQGETILVVEDDRDVCLATSRCLQHGGYVVLTASNGRDALEVLEKHAGIDLILSDVTMPDIGGLELLRHVRAMPTARAVAFALASGYSPDVEEEDDVPLLQKPWEPDELLTFVRRCLDGE